MDTLPLFDMRMTNARLLYDILRLMRETHFRDLSYLEGVTLKVIAIEIMVAQTERK